METQACLIGNRRALLASAEKRETLRHMMEFIEAHMRSKRYRMVTANVRGESASEVAEHVLQQVETAGNLGPTVAPVFPKQAAGSRQQATSGHSALMPPRGHPQSQHFPLRRAGTPLASS